LERLQVPDLDGRVPAPGGHVAVVGAEGHAPDITHMAFQLLPYFARLGIPNLHRMPRFDGAGRRDTPAVGADGPEGTATGIKWDREQRLLSGHVPDPELGIRSASRKKPAVGAKGQTRYRGPMRLEGMGFLSGRRVVDADPGTLAEGEEPAVRAERDRVSQTG